MSRVWEIKPSNDWIEYKDSGQMASWWNAINDSAYGIKWSEQKSSHGINSV